MANADAYIDLHGAQSTESMTPFAAYRSSGNEALDQRTLALAHAFGWTDIVRGASAGGGNTHASTTRAGIPSLLIEIGSRASRSPDEIAAVIAGLDSVCAHLGMRDGTGAAEPVDFKHWVWAAEVEAELDGLWYPEFKMGDHVRRGDTLGRIIDPLDNELARITSPSDGKAFYGEWGLVAMVGGVLAAIAISED